MSKIGSRQFSTSVRRTPLLRFVLLGIRVAVVASHQTSNRFCKLWQFSEDTDSPQPLFVVEGRRAADCGSCGDVSVGATLGRHHYAIADVAVSGNPDLASQDDVLSYDRGTCETDLRAKQRMLSNRRAVSHLHQIVDFDATADSGLADAGTIDTGVRLHLNVTLDDSWAGLRDLLPTFSVASKPKAIAAHYRTVLQNDVVTQNAMFAHHRMRMSKEVVANASATIYDNVRQQYCVVADLDIIIDHHVCPNVRVCPQFCSWCDHRGGVYPRAVLRRLVEQVDCSGERKIRVLAAQDAGGDVRKVFGNDHR